MKIILAKTAGFCFGVKRAVDMAFNQEECGGTYTFGPIIHNEIVTNALEKKGIKAIESLEHEPVHKLIIRSHGVSPKVYEASKSKNIEVIDATCPYVKKIHRLVQKHYELGHGIIVAGSKEHPEIQGINGWANNECIIVKDSEELAQVNFEPNRHYLLVAQTTYKKEVVLKIVESLEEKNISFEFVNTICNATKERQEEAVTIAKQSDAMIIIGSKKSNNTLKLYEISKVHCEKSYCISGLNELKEIDLRNCETIGITAGASTPASVIQEVIQYLDIYK